MYNLWKHVYIVALGLSISSKYLSYMSVEMQIRLIVLILKHTHTQPHTRMHLGFTGGNEAWRAAYVAVSC